ncbi:MAG: GAF domain-containing protein [Saprospiraceae bacterium]|nr:GAF domain-containing protein [Saprospiraceae bacterium]
MVSSSEMPYFVRPSINIADAEKVEIYAKAQAEIDALLQGETHPILKMATINCLLKTHLTYYYWTGFYLVHEEHLIVGPYQGTLGCLHIDFDRGVCGKAAREKMTQIVTDTHALEQGKDHIACDPNSQSEIVVPVFNGKKELIAVFDVDSSEKNSFNHIDQTYSESILNHHFSQE